MQGAALQSSAHPQPSGGHLYLILHHSKTFPLLTIVRRKGGKAGDFLEPSVLNQDLLTQRKLLEVSEEMAGLCLLERDSKVPEGITAFSAKGNPTIT